MSEKEIDRYFSIDIETDGPIPGHNSMLSLGCCVIDTERNIHGLFEVNITRLPTAIQDPDTMKWWRSQPQEVWDYARKDLQDPVVAMDAFKKFVAHTKGSRPAVAVAYPAAFDFMFVYWYFMRFLGECPFGFSCVDIRSFASGALNRHPLKCSKKRLPEQWKTNLPHTHKAIDDAKEQGMVYINALRQLNPEDHDEPVG